MVKIIQAYIPKHNRNRPGNVMKPLYITVHNTSNTARGADAASHAAFVARSSTGVSWHYTVDDQVIYQHLPLNENGWHAGDGRGTGNMKSIGIEICENAEGNFEQAVENAQWLIRKLMGDFGIPLSNVVPHKHWSGKDCPRKLLGRWEQFKAGIAIAHTGSKSTRKPVQAESLSHKAPVSKQKSSKLPSSILKVTKPLTKGPQVTAVQKALSSLYFYPEKGAKNNGIDGYYGPKTANAVKRFQLMNGLVADGIYGPKTKNRIEQLQNK
ncbi:MULTISPECIES: peptidoglycan recognition protein family protein [Bacillus]|uniref:peptidoglycan recognition protein family protein n=1 Tax=Bacillus TaxID=1386 RepID=UPI002112860C|nr:MULTISPECIES: N-acetylmuramoyl-L-alanine amidase [Bacillus]MED1749994.1 N-acetylmuramoyl-L-alanine amidase [Bacillus zhangzhouensis]UUD41893.1 N-acetylmuramoyl-L-alanine amidase [Bacillus pumilus]